MHVHVYEYTFHRYKFLFEILMQLAITFACPMLHLNYAQNCFTHLFDLFVWIFCVAFELPIDFGILTRCTIATVLVIFVFRLITIGWKKPVFSAQFYGESFN